MALSMEVGLGPGHIVLDGEPVPPKRGHSTPIFGPCLMSTNAWMIKTLLGTEVGLGPDNTDRWGPSSPLPPKRGTAPNFRLISIVAKWLYESGFHLV